MYSLVSFQVIRDVNPADTILFAKTVRLQKTTVFLWYAKCVSIFAEGVCLNNNYVKKDHCATLNDSCLNNNKSLKNDFIWRSY